MRTPITYYGGKQRMIKQITAIFPKHKIYCEPFFGGGAIFFAKAPSKIEVINDINDNIANFFEVLRDNFEALKKEIDLTFHSEAQHKKAKKIYYDPAGKDIVKRAWAFWVVTNMSFGGSIHGGWKWCNGAHGSHSGIYFTNRKKDFVKEISVRLNNVQISSRDAIKIINDRDTKLTLFYFDPPYPGSYQGHYCGYTMKEFAQLLERLSSIKGKFILSNFWSHTLRYYIIKNKWNYEKISMPLNVGLNTKKNRKTEVLIWNYQTESKLNFETKN